MLDHTHNYVRFHPVLLSPCVAKFHLNLTAYRVLHIRAVIDINHRLSCHSFRSYYQKLKSQLKETYNAALYWVETNLKIIENNKKIIIKTINN